MLKVPIDQLHRAYNASANLAPMLRLSLVMGISVCASTLPSRGAITNGVEMLEVFCWKRWEYQCQGYECSHGILESWKLTRTTALVALLSDIRICSRFHSRNTGESLIHSPTLQQRRLGDRSSRIPSPSTLLDLPGRKHTNQILNMLFAFGRSEDSGTYFISNGIRGYSWVLNS